ncbi:hypothetical protein GCM10023238_39230 [Streptomyces heliomycini]
MSLPGSTRYPRGSAGLPWAAGTANLIPRVRFDGRQAGRRDVVWPTAQRLSPSSEGKEHPDLLWALRGGGGNFGVVTSFTTG